MTDGDKKRLLFSYNHFCFCGCKCSPVSVDLLFYVFFFICLSVSLSIPPEKYLCKSFKRDSLWLLRITKPHISRSSYSFFRVKKTLFALLVTSIYDRQPGIPDKFWEPEIAGEAEWPISCLDSRRMSQLSDITVDNYFHVSLSLMIMVVLCD